MYGAQRKSKPIEYPCTYSFDQTEMILHSRKAWQFSKVHLSVCSFKFNPQDIWNRIIRPWLKIYLFFFFSRKFECVGTFQKSGRLSHKLNTQIKLRTDFKAEAKQNCSFIKVYFKPEFIFSNNPWLSNISEKNGAENLDVFCQIYPTIIQVGCEI